MNLLYFILGIIVGLLVRRYDSAEKLQELQQQIPPIRDKTQFIEAVSDKEKFQQAKNINDLLS